MTRPERSENEPDRLTVKNPEERGAHDSQAASAADPSRDAHRQSLEDLLGLEGEAFVLAAYHAILGRAPDPAELSQALDTVRHDRRCKAELLMALRYGPEGRRHRVPVQGLAARRLRGGIREAPIVGQVLQVVGGLAKLPRVVKDVKRIKRETDRLGRSIDRLSQAVESRLAGLEREIAQLRAALSGAADRSQDLAAQIDVLSQRLDHQAADAAPLADRVRLILQRLVALERSQAEVPAARPMAGALPAEGALEPAHAVLYAEFEDRFRGTRADIKGRQAVHLGLLAQQDERLAELPVIDVGCGRGEWLELLADHAIPAVGVDLNRVFLAENRARGLDVVESDAVAYLRAQAAGSARAVTGFHIIEHLPFDTLLLLLDEARRVLAEGGLTLFETPNPENLVTAAHKFHYDPTHRHPIPPEVAAFLLRSRRFRDVTIVRLHEDHDPARNEVPDGVLRALLFGPQDYAVVGYR
jgi:SAM-dependent methyltransferase